MTIFRKRWFALCLCILVVILSTLINVKVKFGSLVNDVIDIFYYGTEADAGIYQHLKTISSEAQKLILLGEEYNVDEELINDVEDSVEWLQESIEYSRGYENYIYENYQEIQNSLLKLQTALKRASLTSDDIALLSDCNLTIDNEKAAIESSDYNTAVRSFLKKYNHFPTAQLSNAAGVSMPKLFDRISF